MALRRLRAALLAAPALLGAALPAGGADMGFVLTLNLSPRAQARMAQLREGIIVMASYYGDAAPGADAHTDDVGRIDLGTETFTLPDGATRVQISGRTFRADRLKWVAGSPMVNVNLFSARRAVSDNILACDFVDTEVAKLRPKPVHLRCALITEGEETQFRP